MRNRLLRGNPGPRYRRPSLRWRSFLSRVAPGSRNTSDGDFWDPDLEGHSPVPTRSGGTLGVMSHLSPAGARSRPAASVEPSVPDGDARPWLRPLGRRDRDGTRNIFGWTHGGAVSERHLQNIGIQ